jgi:hypothetical protein
MMARPVGLTQKAAARAQRERARIRSRRVRRLGVLALALALIVPILVLVFDEAESTAPVPLPPAERLLPGGPPARQVVASQGALRLYLPIAQDKVTAVAYHAVEGSLALDPVGTQGNAGVFTRLLRRLFGQEKGTIRYYLIEGGSGPATAGLDVGAPPLTDVYAPVDGTVVGITDLVLAGQAYGSRIDVQPSGSPGLVVSIENVEADEALAVGSVVTAARTRIGSSIDLADVETAALAEFTTDSGQHVHLEVRPAANLALP